MSCRDLEGWEAVSRLRPFDTTPCYEEGILFSVLSVVLLTVSLIRSLTLASLESRHVSSWSRGILVTKIVSILFVLRPLNSPLYCRSYSLVRLSQAHLI